MITWKNASESDLEQFESIKCLLKNHEYLLPYIFDSEKPCLAAPVNELLDCANSFSGGEVVLIQVALDLWSASDNAHLLKVLQTLSPTNLQNLLKSLKMAKLI